MPSATPKAADLVAQFARAGYSRVDPPILQPASVFLDLSGEDLRRRMFLTSDAEGRELCLRPDLTIPTARLHLETAAARAARYCYLGPVFRHGAPGSGELTQAGIEIFGDNDREEAEAEALGRAVQALGHFGIERPAIRIGDRALLTAFMDELDIPAPWRRRLLRDATSGTGLRGDLATLGQNTNGHGDHTAFLAALDGADPKAAKAVVEDLLSIAGITQVGGRTAGDIASRFLEQARLSASASLPAATYEALSSFLAISGEPRTAFGTIRSLIVESRLSGALSMADDDSPLRLALEAFERRLDLLDGRGVDPADMTFDASFGRRLDYYTGFVFELRAPGSGPDEDPIVGGGRYDDLLATLGAPAPVPAVGCAISIDRIEDFIR